MVTVTLAFDLVASTSMGITLAQGTWHRSGLVTVGITVAADKVCYKTKSAKIILTLIFDPKINRKHH